MQFGPLKFNPVYQPKIWGGRRLETFFGRRLPQGQIGESWDISTHADGLSTVSEPERFAGYSLQQLCRMYPQQMLANYDPNFPLLVKLIDANQSLSVQVHPGNTGVSKHEMWYVLDAEPGAQIIYGLKPGTTQDGFIKAIKEGTLVQHLNFVPAQAGDCFYIPAGTVHALGAGLLVAEIQQNSNTVYRVYDWDRVDSAGDPRALHIEEAIAAIDFHFQPGAGSRPLLDEAQGLLVQNEYFTVHKLLGHEEKLFSTSGFEIITNIGQPAAILYQKQSLVLASGDSCLVPACCSEYRIKGISGKWEILQSHL